MKLLYTALCVEHNRIVAKMLDPQPKEPESKLLTAVLNIRIVCSHYFAPVHLAV